ncbi:BTAD domain-containing putative transcriptional regulator, partial [Salmonella sp. SAL4458]|uniref:BTAD domain-containing putative transcriptional regulator n=1 Tax=Salmonella sp. SAL4458 TaxID=3159913 RepID=UPI00397A273F
TGQRARALAQFDQLAAILDRELAAEPEPTTHALVAAIRDGRFPPALRPLEPPAPAPVPAVAETPAGIAAALPTGTVAFLFTDVEGST